MPLIQWLLNLQPISGGSSSSSSSGISISSSSSSGSSVSRASGICCDPVVVTAFPQGGTGCGLERFGDYVYSIGDQYVGVEYSNTCNCVGAIYVNGITPPTFVYDGQVVDITILWNPGCSQFGPRLGPKCVTPMFMTRIVGGKARTYANMSKFIKTALTRGKIKKIR